MKPIASMGPVYLPTFTIQISWVFPKIGVPPNHPFWSTPIFGNTQLNVDDIELHPDIPLLHYNPTRVISQLRR